MQVQKILTENPEMQRDFLQNEQGKEQVKGSTRSVQMIHIMVEDLGSRTFI